MLKIPNQYFNHTNAYSLTTSLPYNGSLATPRVNSNHSNAAAYYPLVRLPKYISPLNKPLSISKIVVLQMC